MRKPERAEQLLFNTPTSFRQGQTAFSFLKLRIMLPKVFEPISLFIIHKYLTNLRYNLLSSDWKLMHVQCAVK